VIDVVVVDAGGANIGSVMYALERLQVRARLSADAQVIGAADRVILPGVGAAATAMARLRELELVATLRGLNQPLLGICLGMQLLFEASEEGGVECLGLVPGVVQAMGASADVRIPHMGWNRLEATRASYLLEDVGIDAQVYFVHSYAAPVLSECVAACSNGTRFAAVVERDNVCGAQFHPERSGVPGARLLRNFLHGAAA
jgi:glutamine amidotransferase